ncbi:MAG: nucleotidyl transferase AbiEii/AbiGii toxin family protein [Alphaproteobacteria bacterium]|nr:nucleotidyl transferase AbiEii/AbiGii toxin family protein [Alphaproteobacteria bacterium]
MKTVLDQMLSKYTIRSVDDKKNALKEVVQEVALCGLSRGGFFKHAAFCGGTALRIFYGLDRFSEDLDFSLIEPNPDFQLQPYFASLENELASVGLKFSAEEKPKTSDSAIKSAFLKGNTKEHILSIYGTENVPISSNGIIKIKLEVDIDPPAYAKFESKYKLLPTSFRVNLYDMPSLFAGKIHAILCRSWRNRVKGRDFYDYVFYLAMRTKVNLRHLRARLQASGVLTERDEFSRKVLIDMLNQRFAMVNFEQAKADVLPYVKDSSKLDLWSQEFFTEISKDLQVVEESQEE